MRLDGKVALVTGTGSGIGAAAPRLFAVEGARVAALGHGHENTEWTVARITAASGEAMSVIADVASPEQLEGALRQVDERRASEVAGWTSSSPTPASMAALLLGRWVVPLA
jgi:NAD(P)-dependent dehydrogenase (short-subunit alcohol dehydrogenase family)